MKPTRVLLAAASSLLVSQVMAGEAIFFIQNEDGKPMDSVAVSVNGTKQLVKNGFAVFDVPAGSNAVEISQYGEWLGDFVLDTESEVQNAEVVVDVLGGEALETVTLYTPGQADPAEAIGYISGYLESAETMGPVKGARVSIDGTEIGVLSDDEGFFELEMPRGSYDLTIKDPNYGTVQLTGVRVLANVTSAVDLTMSMSGGTGDLEEVVAVGSYIPTTATAQQRDSSAVLDAIGSEQFSRFGDSNAASALKRVTGVTVADGKYAVVRGLNERYTSVLLNGAIVPSPDPTRRVVPLDLFPSGVISSVNVEKTAIANRPADAAGATIDILTKDAPEEFEGKLSVSIGHADGTTGKTVTTQNTSGYEVFGFGSSSRDMSSAAKASSSNDTFSGSEGADLLNLNQWETSETTIMPNMSMELTLGDLIGDYSFGSLAYKLTGRYSNEWEYTETDRVNYEPYGSSVREADEYIQYRSVNLVDLSFGGTLSLVANDYTINSNTMLLRQTQADNIEEVGVRGEYRYFTINRDYTWQEREFFSQQFLGEHFFDDFYRSELVWGATVANASLYVPDSRSYSLVDDSTSISTDSSFNPLSTNLSDSVEVDWGTKPTREWTDLKDDSTHFRVDGKMVPVEGDRYELSVSAGIALLSRERDVKSYSFQYDQVDSSLPTVLDGETDIANLLTDNLFAQGYLDVTNGSDSNASYTGTWDYTALYVMPKFEWFETFSVEAGVRLEDSAIEIETAGSNPIVAKVEDSSVYPSLNATYTVDESSQIRLALSSSINRPDFREVAPAQFTDSVSGDRYIGNSSLTESTITSIDVRYEYYFSEDESVNVAMFRKDFTDAIERTSSVISGSSNDILYSFDNNGDAYAQGLEVSASKNLEFDALGLKLSGNASYFDTAIDIYTASGNFDRSRRMQGQPDLLANFQLALDEYESGREYTLVMNYTGESLSAVSTTTLDDEYREARMVVDANIKQPLIYEELDLKLSLKNITDSEVKETQNGKMTKRYNPGREVKLSLSYQF